MPIIYGDSSIGRPFEATWKSGTDTITVRVYKATSNETSETWTSRILSAMDTELAAHPPG